MADNIYTLATLDSAMQMAREGHLQNAAAVLEHLEPGNLSEKSRHEFAGMFMDQCQGEYWPDDPELEFLHYMELSRFAEQLDRLGAVVLVNAHQNDALPDQILDAVTQRHCLSPVDRDDVVAVIECRHDTRRLEVAVPFDPILVIRDGSDDRIGYLEGIHFEEDEEDYSTKVKVISGVEVRVKHVWLYAHLDERSLFNGLWDDFLKPADMTNWVDNSYRVHLKVGQPPIIEHR